MAKYIFIKDYEGATWFPPEVKGAVKQVSFKVGDIFEGEKKTDAKIPESNHVLLNTPQGKVQVHDREKAIKLYAVSDSATTNPVDVNKAIMKKFYMGMLAGAALTTGIFLIVKPFLTKKS